MYIADAYDQWVEYDANKEKELLRLPVCEYCGEAIQDEHCIEYDGMFFHEDCFLDEHRKSTESVAR